MGRSSRQAGRATVAGLPRRTLCCVLLVLAPVAVGTLLLDPGAAHGASTGSVSAFGDAAPSGSPAGNQLNAPLTGMATTADGQGYWLAGADGGVFSFGDAAFYGSEGGSGLRTPFVGIAPTPSGHGYWIANIFGSVYNFGDAPQESPQSVFPAAPMVGIVGTADGHGYWLVGADGGVFSFGDAAFYGSMGATPLNAPVVGMATTADGHGYWLVGADGGVFSFGDAAFYGSMGATPLNAPVVGMATTADGHGYWLVGADGGVFSFGDAAFYGSMGANPPSTSTPVVAMARTADGGGYWLTTTGKDLPPPSPVPSVLDQCNDPTAGPAVTPGTIVLASADANTRLTNLAWSSWTQTGATAVGDYTQNLCIPDCAQGTFISPSATVQLGYPVQTSAGREFASVSYTYTDPSAPGGFSGASFVVPTSPG